MQMHAEIKFIHHVGHVVSDMEATLELYRKLGFVCSTPSYPALAESEGELPKPFGAANSHVEFLSSFIEIVTVAEKGARIPINAKLVPLQASPDVLQVIIGKIKRTVDTVSRCLSRYEGAHILCFGTEDADQTANGVESVIAALTPCSDLLRCPEEFNLFLCAIWKLTGTTCTKVVW
ncbi:VOC family protein [Bacillus toyonensis]|uniref:VOC family protein n=1 Tax=Bacillus toyonensis TaxID=155322 RepID=UPI00211D2DA9|nr:VOC family protein [Bacillus toyonensis]